MSSPRHDPAARRSGRGVSRGLRMLVTALVLAGLAVVAVGCGDKAALDGTSWRLVGWSISAIDSADFTVTAQFQDGQMGGTSAVNTYGAPYETGGDGDLSIGSIMATEMAGPEPAMQAEAAYFDLLRQVRAYRLEDDRLTLLDGNGNELLLFSPAEI